VLVEIVYMVGECLSDQAEIDLTCPLPEFRCLLYMSISIKVTHLKGIEDEPNHNNFKDAKEPAYSYEQCWFKK
jgi:hypothetical protein